MEIKGRVIINLGVQSGMSKAGKQWSKASIVVETEGQYPKKIAMDNLKNADTFGALAVGTVGTFYIEVSSNEFNGRWYTSVNCYKWEVASPYPQQPYAPQQPYQQPPSAQPFYGPAQSYPVNPQSATPTLDSMGVKGYQPMQQTTPETNGDDDLPF
ncbi:MAG: DUF3127 domain-containing protein [Muribaculaceae bacterium]|nr:DUF3127 domain-containing protein [Muribaculaceae bacterium]